jgi:HD-like signal output (HDOD) protein
MASCFSDQYNEIVCFPGGNLSLADRERNIFDVTHAEAGAYLMELWGLPHTIIEAIYFHHSPGRAATMHFSPLTSVHIGNILAHEETGEGTEDPDRKIDYEYLSAMDLKMDRSLAIGGSGGAREASANGQ